MDWNQWISPREVATLHFWRDVISEFMVSFFMLIYVTMAMVTLNSELYQIDMMHMGIMVGFMIFLLIEGYGPVSGFMNPSAALARCLSGRLTFFRALLYMLSECAGAIAGTQLIYVLTPDDLKADIKAFQPAASISPWQGMIIELLLTYNLLYVGLSVSDSRTHKVQLPGLATGFTIGVGIMTGGTWTGACQNPIVALGPAVVTRNYQHHWIYWTGSFLAAILASVYDRCCYMARNKTTEYELSGRDSEQNGLPKGKIISLKDKEQEF